MSGVALFFVIVLVVMAASLIPLGRSSKPLAESVVRTRDRQSRRECTDHLIALGERRLITVLREFVAYYNQSRCHLSLDGDAPEARTINDGLGKVIATPVLDGLHHTYSRTA